MQRTPKKHAKKATALTNAKPEFVSIVKTGANMMPFRAMKSEDQPENSMKLKTKAATHDIAKLVFKGDAFSEEAAVAAWLEAGGYEGVTIVKHDDGTFSVTDPDAPTEGLVEVETDGVTAFVFQKAESVAKDATIAAEAPTAEGSPSLVTAANGADVQPVAKTDEPNEQVAAAEPAAKTDEAQAAAPVVLLVDGALSTAELEAVRAKFDEYDVAYSDELTLSDTLADGFDGIPPGFGEVMTAVYAATRNAIIVGQVGSIDAIFTDAAAVVKKLASIFPADVPMTIDTTVFLEEDFAGAAYVVREEGKEPVLDEVRLRGDLYFPELTIAQPALVLQAQKEEGGEEVLKQKRDMSDRRKRVQMKAYAKQQEQQDQDGSAQDASAQGSNGGANGNTAKPKNSKKETSEAGDAAPNAGDALTAALSAALAPALAAITGLTESIKASSEKAAKEAADARTAAEAQIEQVKKEAAEAIAEVQKAAVERQTRKAADADECDTGNTTTVKSEQQQRATKSVADMRLRGALGMPRPNR